MIKHSIKENTLYVSISNVDFSYRIPLDKLGNSIDWRIGPKGPNQIVMENVSKWTLQLFTKNVTEAKYIKQFMAIVQENSPGNTVHWENTISAVNLQNQYHWLSKTNTTAEKKQTEDEMMDRLKKKFNL